MDVGGVCHNHSMIQEGKMTLVDKTRQRFRVRFLDDPRINAPIGHIYSVFCEELGIENPNMESFIEELNGYINDYDSKIKRPPFQKLGYYGIPGLQRMLQDYISKEKMSVDSAVRVLDEALGNCDYQGLAQKFYQQ